jgi:uncharacterized membrane protein (UPF0127 family)
MDADPAAGLRLHRATSIVERFAGLIGRPPLGPAEGLVFERCDAVHTFAMRVAIDVVFLDRSGRVMRVAERLAPWRIAWTPGAHTVIETAAGTTRRLGIVPGRVLTLQ